MNNTSPRILISILNWNNYSDTIKAVYSVLESDYKQFQIIIIDNASGNDSVLQLKKEFPKIQFIQSKKNNGYAAGHFISAQKAMNENFDALWILNNDLVVLPNTLSNFIEAFAHNPNAIYGSNVIQNNENLTYQNKEVDYAHGASIFIPTWILKKYGFMRTDFFLYGEETEFCIRLKQKYNIPSIELANSKVLHQSGGSFKMDKKLNNVQIYYKTRNLVYLQIKYKQKSYTDIIKTYFNGRMIFLKKIVTLPFQIVKTENDYITLAIFHAFIKNLGKTIKPEKKIKQ